MRRAWCRLLALSGGATRGSSLVRIGGRLCGNYHIEKMYKMQFLETESATTLSASSVSEATQSHQDPSSLAEGVRVFTQPGPIADLSTGAVDVRCRG
jgi:hypothetical protein